MSHQDTGQSAGSTSGASDAARRRLPAFPGGGFGRSVADAIDAATTRVGAVFEREMEAGRGFLWLPACFGGGIVVYFALPREPSLVAVFLVVLVLFASAAWNRHRVTAFRVLVAVATVATGTFGIKLRTDMVATPMLVRETTTSVTGWVAEAEASARGGTRLVILVHDIEGLPPASTPATVRVTVRSKAGGIAVGDALTMRARLSPPSGPVLPGGYDFARGAFYEGLGGIGFAYGAAQSADIGDAPLAIRIEEPVASLRATIRGRVVEALPGDNGKIAAALIMGDQGGISEPAQEAMRASGLGHVLSISGLHMALVAGSAFWLIRALLALSPSLALRYPIKKWAAAAALAVAAFYLAISGAGVATVRAFIMLAIMLLAILADRRAITLRNVAIAALAILLIEPESLLSASFQMSFAATVALVAGYEAITEHRDRRVSVEASGNRVSAKVSAWIVGLFLTSLIAGFATTPFAVFHFQRLAPLSLLANLAAMPAVGLIVMPMALISVLAMPFGLEALPLSAMSLGLDWMMAVAVAAEAWSSDLGLVRMAPIAALLLFVAGFLWLALWRERWRFAGLLPMIAAVPISLAATPPDVIIDESGEAVAVRAADGRLGVIGARGHSFEVENWLRADADPRKLPLGEQPGIRCDPHGCTAPLADGRLVALAQTPAAFADDCATAAVVISRYAAPENCAAHGAIVVDRPALALGGAQSIYLMPGAPGGAPEFRVETAYPPIRRPYMPPLPSQ
jgi:competence protein ComEC